MLVDGVDGTTESNFETIGLHAEKHVHTIRRCFGTSHQIIAMAMKGKGSAPMKRGAAMKVAMKAMKVASAMKVAKERAMKGKGRKAFGFNSKRAKIFRCDMRARASTCARARIERLGAAPVHRANRASRASPARARSTREVRERASTSASSG